MENYQGFSFSYYHALPFFLFFKLFQSILPSIHLKTPFSSSPVDLYPIPYPQHSNTNQPPISACPIFAFSGSVFLLLCVCVCVCVCLTFTQLSTCLTRAKHWASNWSSSPTSATADYYIAILLLILTSVK